MDFTKQLAVVGWVLAGVFLGYASWKVSPLEVRPQSVLEMVEVQVVMISKQEGCHLSKVRLYDDKGVLYQVPGCNSGKVALAPGRGFGWVEHLGQETVGFSVYVSH